MIKLDVYMPDASIDALRNLTSEEFFEFMARAEGIQTLGARHSEAWQRTVLFWYLLIAGTVVLGISLFLIIGQAAGMTELPENAIATMIGSVAVEFIGMLWLVVRYLFPQGGREQ